MDQLKAMGNARGANLWEATMVEGERIGSGASRQEREAFVWAKYVGERWKKLSLTCDLTPI